MKKSFKLIAATIFASLSVGAVIGAVSTLNKKQIVSEASSSDTVYITGSYNSWSDDDPDSVMTYDPSQSAFFVQHYFALNDEFGAKYNGTWCGAGGVTELKIGDDTIFSKKDNNWKCDVAGDYIIYVKDGTGGYGDKSYGFYVGVPAITEAAPEQSSDTLRVWTRAEFSWWYNDEALTGVHYYYNSADHFCVMNNIENTDNGLYYWYVDIPVTSTGFQFIRLRKDQASIFNYSVWVEISSVDTTQVYYIIDESGDDFGNRKLSLGIVDNPSVELFKTVLASFLSCSSSTLNGFGAYDDLENNWYNQLSAEEKASLSTTNMSDYDYDDYVDNGKSYSGLTKEGTTTIADKWLEMGSNSSGAGSKIFIISQNSESNNIITIAIIVSVITLTAVAGFFFFKKKRV